LNNFKLFNQAQMAKKCAVSHGVIFLDLTKKRILLVKNSSSFADGALISGRRWYNLTDINKEFADMMTLQEKKNHLEDPLASDYIKKFKHYQRNNLACCSESKKRYLIKQAESDYKRTMFRLRPLIQESYDQKIDGVLPWSFPKCRISHYMDPLSEIAKEMQEELNVSPDTYQLLPLTPFEIKYSDMGLDYKLVLYFASVKKDFIPKIDRYNLEQTDEISDIRWFSYEELESIPLERITRKHVLGNFKKIFEHYERHYVRSVVDFVKLLGIKLKKGSPFAPYVS